ncbi:hypothetical protein KY289_023214 [Solanum tuberosum]|nr:hypothetical protein KY289_023214 [Solanum tuberosum]
MGESDTLAMCSRAGSSRPKRKYNPNYNPNAFCDHCKLKEYPKFGQHEKYEGRQDQSANRFKYKRGGGHSAYNAAHNVVVQDWHQSTQFPLQNQMHNYYDPAPAPAPNVVANSLQEVPFPGQYRVDDGPRFTQSQYENICHMLDKNQANQMQEQSYMNTTHLTNMTGSLHWKVKKIGKEVRGFYYIAGLSIPKAQAAKYGLTTVNVTTTEVIGLWHKRMSHVSASNLTKIVSAITQQETITYAPKNSRDVEFKENIFPFANVTSSLHTLFPQPELYHDNDPLLSITINPSSSLQQLTSSNNDTLTPTDVVAKPHMVQPIVEPVSQLISQLQQQSIAQPTMRSTRGIHPPCWMKEFVSLTIDNNSRYALSNYISYDHVHPKYVAFISVVSSVTEPSTYAEAIKDK